MTETFRVPRDKYASWFLDKYTGKHIRSRVESAKKPSMGTVRYYLSDNIPHTTFQNTEQLMEYRALRGDARRNVLVNNIDAIALELLYMARLTSTKALMPIPTYKTLSRLIKLIQYRNIILLKREELIDVLGVRTADINKIGYNVDECWLKLYTQPPYVEKGYVKILINPILAFRYNPKQLEEERVAAISAWYGNSHISAALALFSSRSHLLEKQHHVSHGIQLHRMATLKPVKDTQHLQGLDHNSWWRVHNKNKMLEVMNNLKQQNTFLY